MNSIQTLYDSETDEPTQLAKTILDALEENGETPMGASVLTMDIIDDSLLELG